MKNAKSIMLFYGILSGIISIGLTLLQYFTNSYNGSPLSVFFLELSLFFYLFFLFLWVFIRVKTEVFDK